MANGVSKKAVMKGGAIAKANLADAPAKSNSDPRIKGGRPSHITSGK